MDRRIPVAVGDCHLHRPIDARGDGVHLCRGQPGADRFADGLWRSCHIGGMGRRMLGFLVVRRGSASTEPGGLRVFVVRARGQALAFFPDTGSPVARPPTSSARLRTGSTRSWQMPHGRLRSIGRTAAVRRGPDWYRPANPFEFPDLCGAAGMTPTVGGRSAATNCTTGRHQDRSIAPPLSELACMVIQSQPRNSGRVAGSAGRQANDPGSGLPGRGHPWLSQIARQTADQW